MNILGMGVVFTRGRGRQALAAALEQGWVPPQPGENPYDRSPAPAYRVAPETLSDKTLLARLRRADRFSRLAALAASDAMRDAAVDIPDRTRLGVVFATALGPHATTFRFLDDILEFGDPGVSPTTFSHSVHNAAASYIASLLDIRGPTLTVTHFHFAVHEALRLAQTWLAEGRCNHVLVGAADECGSVMEHVCARRMTVAADGKIKPLAFSKTPETVPGEGSAFFLLSDRSTAHAVADIDVIDAARAPADLHLVDAAGLVPDESGYADAVRGSPAVAGYTPLFGGIPTGTSIHAAAAAVMLAQQRRFACPVPINSGGISPVAETTSLPIGSVVCTTLDCYSQARSLKLTRHEP